MRQGILYVALNDINFIDYFDLSVASLRKEGYTGDVCLLTNFKHIEKKDGIEYKFLDIKKEEPIRASRRIKTQLNKFTPYERTLFLDCDTLILNPIDKVWNYSSAFAVTKDLNTKVGKLKPSDIRFRADELAHTLREIGPEAVYYSSSTILWDKSEESDLIFDHWHKEWQKFLYTDQMSLARAINKNKLKVTELPYTYNVPLTRFKSYKEAKDNGSIVYAVWGSNREKYLDEYKSKELS